MASTSSPSVGVQTLPRILADQPMVPFAGPSSEQEGMVGQTRSPSSIEEIPDTASPSEGRLIADFLKLLKRLLDIIAFRKPQQSNSERLPSPQPNPSSVSVMKASVGDDNEHSGNILNGGTTTIVHERHTGSESEGTQGPVNPQRNIPPVFHTKGGNNNKSSCNIINSGTTDITYR